MSAIELEMTFREIFPDEGLLATARTAGAAMQRRLDAPAQWAVALERNGERFAAEVLVEGATIAARATGTDANPRKALESAFDALGRDLDRRGDFEPNVAML